MKKYGYARVNTQEQNLDRQIQLLYKAGLDDRNILIDKESGRHFNRQSYLLLVGTEESAPLLRQGDLLIITSLNQLGRSYAEVHNQWRKITQQLSANIKVLDMPLLDTTPQPDANSLNRKFIADLTLQILSYAAEEERQSILERQRQGIEAVKNAGKHLGRSPIQYPPNWDELYTAWQADQLRTKDFIAVTGLHKSTFYKLIEKYRKDNNKNGNRV